MFIRRSVQPHMRRDAELGVVLHLDARDAIGERFACECMLSTTHVDDATTKVCYMLESVVDRATAHRPIVGFGTEVLSVDFYCRECANRLQHGGEDE